MRSSETREQKVSGLRGCSPQFGKLAPQCEFFCKTSGHVAQNGNRSVWQTAFIAKHDNRERNGDSCAAFGQRRNGQQVACAVAACARRHRVPVSVPVPRPEILRNDEIERLSDCLVRRESENARCAGVPVGDDAIAVGRDDGIRCGGQKRLGKTGGRGDFVSICATVVSDAGTDFSADVSSEAFDPSSRGQHGPDVCLRIALASSLSSPDRLRYIVPPIA